MQTILITQSERALEEITILPDNICETPRHSIVSAIHSWHIEQLNV